MKRVSDTMFSSYIFIWHKIILPSAVPESLYDSGMGKGRDTELQTDFFSVHIKG